MIDDAYKARLDAAKRASTIQLLFRAARLLNEQALERAHAGQPGPRVRPAHTALFPHIDLEGTRPTELARRLGVTKQAASQLVHDLEAMGVLEKVPDPADGRARLIRFTPLGQAGLLRGLATLRELEAELAAALGDDRLAALHATLTDLLAHLDET